MYLLHVFHEVPQDEVVFLSPIEQTLIANFAKSLDNLEPLFK